MIPACASGGTVKVGDAQAARRLTRPGSAAGHPVSGQRQERRRWRGLCVPDDVVRRASAMAGTLGRGRRQRTPALLGVG